MKSRLAAIAAILGFALLLNGCAPIDSLFPLYKADDAVFDDRLLGTWKPVATDDSDKDERWYISRPEERNSTTSDGEPLEQKAGFSQKHGSRASATICLLTLKATPKKLMMVHTRTDRFHFQ